MDTGQVYAGIPRAWYYITLVAYKGKTRKATHFLPCPTGASVHPDYMALQLVLYTKLASHVEIHLPLPTIATTAEFFSSIKHGNLKKYNFSLCDFMYGFSAYMHMHAVPMLDRRETLNPPGLKLQRGL